jgi:hypothetical protein
MIRFKRRNTAWLISLALLIGFALLAAPVTPALQAALLGIFVVAALASSFELGRERQTLIEAIRKAPLRQRISPQAKEAAERAKSRGGFVNDRLMMLDLGLIINHTSYEGMVMRRTRNVSKDDDAVRPFVTLYVDPEEADRHAVLRFEIYNEHGEQQYVHEMKPYLRDGEVTIMADYHLPLAGNDDIRGGGSWDMRVYMDGNLVGMHDFSFAPSLEERSSRLAGERGTASGMAYYDIIDEEEQEMSVTLQDLLQQERAASTSNRTSRRRS